jgi:DNA-binding CsgD family transcriptional regulator
MMTGPDALTSKEKETLRLILRGHDAKSSARELGLSVHTVNERLREARRKLGVTSSREAARRLLAEEGEAPENPPQFHADKALGDAAEAPIAADMTAPANLRWAWFGLGPGLALTSIGVLAMSLIFAALLLPASLVSTPTAPAVSAAAATTAAEPDVAAAARAAEDFLALVDEGRWAESYAATGAQFRQLNTLERWTEVSEQVRPPLGKTLTRDIVGNEFVPAPPQGYQLIKFRSTYANGTQQTESVSLAWEEGAWKVAGVTFEPVATAAAAPSDAPVNLDAVQGAARTWLALIDKGEWQASHAASGASFRSAITAPRWAEMIAQVREPLGPVAKRALLEYGSQSAPREVRIVLFRTDFANAKGATETVTLEREGGEYRVVGYWIK